MILLWTKNNKIGSQIIRYGLDEDFSHFATVFFTRDGVDGGVVVHHNFAGFQLDWFPAWRKKNQVVRSLVPKEQTRDTDRILFRAIASAFSPLHYDKPSFFYFCWRAFLRKFFGEPLPKTNQWNSGKNVLCTGQAKIMMDTYPHWFSEPIEDFDIVTPGQLLTNLTNSGEFR